MRLRKNYFVNRGIQQREGIRLAVFRPTSKGNFFTTLISGKFVFQPAVHTAHVACLVYLISGCSHYCTSMKNAAFTGKTKLDKKRIILNVT